MTKEQRRSRYELQAATAPSKAAKTTETVNNELTDKEMEQVSGGDGAVYALRFFKQAMY
jgi:bacteriocin-like protein